jgi:hypothetical protein
MIFGNPVIGQQCHFLKFFIYFHVDAARDRLCPGRRQPYGPEKRLKTVIDTSNQSFPAFYVGAGRRGWHMALNSEDMKQLTGGSFVAIYR